MTHNKGAKEHGKCHEANSCRRARQRAVVVTHTLGERRIPWAMAPPGTKRKAVIRDMYVYMPPLGWRTAGNAAPRWL